jgi:hypothetical protein
MGFFFFFSAPVFLCFFKPNRPWLTILVRIIGIGFIELIALITNTIAIKLIEKRIILSYGMPFTVFSIANGKELKSHPTWELRIGLFGPKKKEVQGELVLSGSVSGDLMRLFGGRYRWLQPFSCLQR